MPARGHCAGTLIAAVQAMNTDPAALTHDTYTSDMKPAPPATAGASAGAQGCNWVDGEDAS